MTRPKPSTDAVYRAEYEKGWRYSGLENASLDNSYYKSNAWIDGYMDRACGREKWHFWHCRQMRGCEEHKGQY